MKGIDLIKFIKENNLEDFNLEFSFTDGFDGGFPNRRTFEIEEVADVGYSSKVICLDGNEMS